MDNVFDKHQIKIAKATLRYSDAGALIMGGMDKAQARTILQQHGYSDAGIRKMEGAEP